MMLEEKNKATLQRAIRQLPQYEPEDGIWVAVEKALDHADEGEQLQSSLRLLPSYEAPQQVWEQIREELDAEDEKTDQPKRRILPYWRQVAAAASVLLLVGIGWGLFSGSDAPTITIAESEALMPVEIVSRDWNADEALFRQVIQRFGEHPLLEADPQIQNLKIELEELNEAKSEIELMMEKYGEDPELIRRIGEIERERSEVIKRMVTFI